MMQMMIQNTLPFETNSRCCHCDSLLPPQTTSNFCCHGCQTAFDFIKKMQLENYYQLLKDQKPRSLQNKSFQDYLHFDQSDFQQRFCSHSSPQQSKAHLFLSNLDCYACVWVCEKAISQAYPDASISVNMAKKMACLSFNPETTRLSDLASLLDQLGYPPSPNSRFKDDSHKELLKLGVAFFCFMNIMLLSAADYLSEDLRGTVFYGLFRYISMGLTLVALLYPGTTFYRNTLLALKARKLHLDIPITLALISSFSLSAYYTIQNSGPVYFDSITAIICLLLLGRYIQREMLNKHYRQLSLESQNVHLVRRLTEDGEDIVRTLSLEPGDMIRILPGGIVPVDCRLQSPEAQLRMDVFTGEDIQHFLVEGQTVEAGSMNQNTPIVMECLQAGSESIIAQVDSMAEGLMEEKGRFLVTSEKLAKCLVAFILTVAALVFFYHFPVLDEAVSRSVTCLLIACPCAFGLGSPLILSRALHLGLGQGLIFRNQKALEILPEVKGFFFDKTGTLTQPAQTPQLVAIQEQLGDKRQMAAMLSSLRNYSEHHVAIALSNWGQSIATTSISQQLDGLTEVFGQGLQFKWQGHDIKIGRESYCLDSSQNATPYTYITKNSRVWGAFSLEEELKPGAQDLVAQLQKQGAHLKILSGDEESKVRRTKVLLGMEDSHHQGSLNPQDKLKELNRRQMPSAMIGNGINDALALAASTISIAVYRSSEYAKKFSDIILIKDDLMAIKRGIDIAVACKKAFHRSFAFAFSFNLIGITLAALGYLTPVVAAVLMPLSSLTVIYLSSHWQGG